LDRFGDEPTEWQAKTCKVVLAVLVCRNPDPGGHEFLSFTGMNFELSQPTGSRCAEQSAIGAAVAQFVPRQEMRAIAVLDPLGPNNPLAPCGVCIEMLRKIQKDSPDFKLIEFPDFENEQFDLIRSWFPGRLSTVYDTLPKELQIWTCNFCGYEENTPHASRCMNCKEETRSLSVPSKNQIKMLQALLDMRTICPETNIEHLNLDVPAWEVNGPLTKTKLFHHVQHQNEESLIGSILKQEKKPAATKSLKKEQRKKLAKVLQEPGRFAELLQQAGEKAEQRLHKRLKGEIVKFIRSLSSHGLGGVLRLVDVGPSGQERKEYSFTEFGLRYLNKFGH